VLRSSGWHSLKGNLPRFPAGATQRIRHKAPHAVQIILPQPFGPVGSKLSISTRRLTVSPYSVTASKICFLISARGVLRHRSSNAYCSLCHHGRDMAEVGSFPLTYVTISTVTLSALKRMTINP
jgi:hypothetical protein